MNEQHELQHTKTKITMHHLLSALHAQKPTENTTKYFQRSEDNKNYEILACKGPKGGGPQSIDLSIEDLQKNTGAMDVLQAIINEDWSSATIDIDVPGFTISKNYLSSKINAIDACDLSLPDRVVKGEKENPTDYQRVIYATLSIKFYLEKEIQRISLPSNTVSLEKARVDFLALKNQKTGNRDQLGKDAANYFMEEQRVKCPFLNNPSLHDVFHSSRLIGKLSNHMNQHKALDKKFIKGLYMDFVPTQFKPFEVQNLVEHITSTYGHHIRNYFNPCGGWGDRLIGALATPSIERYIETDPNPALMPIKQRMCEAFNHDPAKDIHLYDLPVEDLSPEQYAPKGIQNDLVLYSPPYFKMERYPGDEQSYRRYPQYAQWFDCFLMQSVEVSLRALQPDRIFAINLAKIVTSVSRCEKSDTPQEFKERMATQYGHCFEWKEDIPYATKFRRGSDYSQSFIHIYQTKAIAVSPGKELSFSSHPASPSRGASHARLIPFQNSFFEGAPGHERPLKKRTYETMSAPSHPMVTDPIAMQFYQKLSTLGDSSLHVNRLLHDYIKMLYTSYALHTPVLCVDENVAQTTPTLGAYELPLDDTRVMIPFSGGMDSTAAILLAQRQNLDIYLLHIYRLNSAAADRELKAVIELAEHFKLSDKLTILQQPPAFQRMKAYKEMVPDLAENPAKNQYIWLLALPYMKHFRCKKIWFACQNNNAAPHFSDRPISFQLFYQYAESIVGEHEWRFPYPNKGVYASEVMAANLASKTSSCISRGDFFTSHQNKIRKNHPNEHVLDNECGSCQKCKAIRGLRNQIHASQFLSLNQG